MRHLNQFAARAAGFALVAFSAACANTGGLGNVLGGVLGQPSGSSTLSATVQRVDTRYQSIQVRTQDGQYADVRFDNQTQVVYNNQRYAVTSLDPGDYVNLRITQTGNNEYYTDYIQVTQPSQSTSNGGVYNGGTSGSGQVTRITGTVDRVDYSNGIFRIRDGYGSVTTVYMPYNPRRADSTRFQRLRSGDYVDFDAVYLSGRLELRRFY
jgi:hypothetical protein